MKIFKKYFVLVLSFFVLSILLPQNVQGWRPFSKKARVVKSKAVRTKKYKYIQKHDLNKDGKVDAKDRLLWLRKNKEGRRTVYVSKENEDIVETMDMNGDGNVESWEMEQFYNKYDLNGNGTLDDEEIAAALD